MPLVFGLEHVVMDRIRYLLGCKVVLVHHLADSPVLDMWSHRIGRTATGCGTDIIGDAGGGVVVVCPDAG